MGNPETIAALATGSLEYKLEPIVRLDENGKFAGIYAYEILSMEKPPVGAREDFRRFEAFTGLIDEPYRLHVNLYPSTVIAYENQVRTILGRLRKKKDIVVEIVENGGIKESLHKALNASNAKISIDDFGTGAANFDRLFALKNVTSVKIDSELWRVFSAAGMLVELLKMLEAAHIDVIAEKVETQGDLDRLHRIGFRLFQGHFFNKSKDYKSIRARVK